MYAELLSLFALSVLISISTFGGGSQALYYQYAVVQNQWLTKSDLSAVLAFGYATPGPAAFGTSTFIGYSLAGIPGAAIGTLGIFIVPFIASFLAAHYLRNLTQNIHVRYFVRGIGLAATGLVAATAYSLLEPFDAAGWQLLIAAGAFTISLAWNINPFPILMVGLILGIIII